MWLPSGCALGQFFGLRPYFTVYLSSRPNTDTFSNKLELNVDKFFISSFSPLLALLFILVGNLWPIYFRIRSQIKPQNEKQIPPKQQYVCVLYLKEYFLLLNIWILISMKISHKMFEEFCKTCQQLMSMHRKKTF